MILNNLAQLDQVISWQDIASEMWLRGELSWKLHKAQLIIYKLVRSLARNTREALLFCARRFGKSFLGVILAFEDCLRNPGVQVAIIGPTLKQTKKILAPIIKKIIADAPSGLVRQLRASDTWHFSNGSVLMLGGFDTILESFRGVDLYSLYLEETGLSTDDLDEYKYLLYSVLFPTLMHSRGRIHHLTTPSRIVDHPLHVETLPKCKLSDAFYLFDIHQNPLLSPQDIEEEIQLLGGLGSISVDRELFCRIRRDDSITVVTTFDEDRHVQAIEASHQLVWMIGGDLGYTDDLSTFLWGGYDHNIGKKIIRSELWFEPCRASSEIIEGVKEKNVLPIWKHPSYQHHRRDDFRDPTNPVAVVDIQGNTRTDMSALDFSTAEPMKDKFDSTITYIRNEFYNDRLLIHPDCKLLIETLRSAVFNKSKTDFRKTSTLGHADMLMALVYLCRAMDTVTDLRPRPSKAEVFELPRKSEFEQNIEGLTAWESIFR